MPTYSYRCTECGHAFDVQQSFTDDALTECPSCGGRLRKVFSPVGITFNGSGFYRTDSRAATRGASGSGESAGATGSGSSGSGDGSSGSGSSGSGAAGTTSGSGSSGSGSSGSGSRTSGSSAAAS